MNSLQQKVLSLEHVLTPGDIVNLAMRMLDCINREITQHSFRTAYLALNISRFYDLNPKCNEQTLILLSLFHTIGFFHEDVFFNYSPFDSNPDYFSDDKSVVSKYIFAGYYLKYMTPLGKDAQSLLKFTIPVKETSDQSDYLEEYKNIIYFCARLSDFIAKNPDKKLPKNLIELDPQHFTPKLTEAFWKAERKFGLVKNIKKTNYQPAITGYLYQIQFNSDDTKQLEKLLVYFIDFKSTCTMKHCVNTSCYAFALGVRMGLNHHDLSSLYTSALLHDIGKMATPQRILEYPGKLSPEDMGIMRYHVKHSKRLLTGFVPDDILINVYRHHEKLNGFGYPCRIKGEEINLIQRILTVADITSALSDSRSYKTEFSRDQIVEILMQMTDAGELDFEVTKFVRDDYDNLIKDLKDLQAVLKVDFSLVVSHYNSYIFNDIQDFSEKSSEASVKISESAELEEL